MPDIDSAAHPTIYRAILKRRWYDAGRRQVTSGAFILRQETPTRPAEKGLSVLKRVNDCSLPVCMAELDPCYGEFILETQRVIGLGLRVLADEQDDPAYSENHAEIRGLPADPFEAENVATLLARLARLHYDRHGKF